jgi:N-acyl homoserine lactone hydrolase
VSDQLRIDRVGFGTFVRPGSETVDGRPRVETVLGYAVHHPQGVVLLDTGLGEAGPETEAHYRPRRVPLPQALQAVGLRVDDVRLVVNCHLHFDHCGGNPQLPGRPVVVQRRELELAHGPDHTVPELVDAPGLTYEVLDGDAELLPGLHVLATPGHTAGHQSLAVRGPDGTVLLAGQTHDGASAFAADVLAAQARGLGHGDPLPDPPAWLAAVLALDPREVRFAHDQSVWRP